MPGQHRDDIKIGAEVEIVLKADQPTGQLTRGIVEEILTNSGFHPHGIKVRLEDGRVEGYRIFYEFNSLGNYSPIRTNRRIDIKMKSFKEKVLAFVKKIPKGKVVSYGQVAAVCGHPRAPRQVGMILKYLDTNRYLEVPWWRVINSQGIISIKGNWTATKELQRDLLIKDGVKINEDFTIDIEKYRWKIK